MLTNMYSSLSPFVLFCCVLLSRSVSLNSLESAAGCDGGGPDSASNSSSELHTSSTTKGAASTSSATAGSSTTASATPAVATTSAQPDGAAPTENQSVFSGPSTNAGRPTVGAGKPPSGASSSSSTHLNQAAASSSSYAGGGSSRAGSPGVAQGSAGIAATGGGSGIQQRGQLPPLQLPLSSEHNYSMQPPPSPRQHRSASSGEVSSACTIIQDTDKENRSNG